MDPESASIPWSSVPGSPESKLDGFLKMSSVGPGRVFLQRMPFSNHSKLVLLRQGSDLGWKVVTPGTCSDVHR